MEKCFGLQAWLDALNEAELPVLGAVVLDLQRLSRADQVAVGQLAQVLLRDASLTAKVMRVANSAYYNPSLENIRSMSRAIILLGFEHIRAISLSVSLVDNLLARSSREQLKLLLARSFHAAVQARNIAGYVLRQDQEEVFVAALLHNLGELAFWGCAGDVADDLAHQLEQPGIDLEKAVQRALGTSFEQLNQSLIRHWGLSELAAVSGGQSQHQDLSRKAISLGLNISEAALLGWDSPQMKALVSQLARLIGVSEDAALKQILQSANEAVEVAATFGASQLCRLIPSTDPEQITLQRQERLARLLQPDALIQQQALLELGLLQSHNASIETVLDALFRGLHQGVGLERVMLLVLSDGRRQFRVRRALGEGTQDWPQIIKLAAEDPLQPHIFSYVLRHQEAIWLGVPASYSLAELVTEPLQHFLGQGMFFIAPLSAGKRPIGVLYADRRISGRALSHEQFVAFQRFTQLAGRCLEMLSKT